ncbi:hypothetical protein [Streptomyces sp. NPDC052107]|uniref:hypothetical protein n=1 Tax=Streptomyces sp. NPDC052107 TaxID=3155632 RepID=UPI00343EBB51
MEEVAERTGLTLDRVHECLRMLIKRGRVRQVGLAGEGTPVYVLPQSAGRSARRQARSRKKRLRLRAFAHPTPLRRPEPVVRPDPYPDE